MALHAAEEESIESLKKWWDENGKSLVAAIIVIFGGYTGWLLWQNSTADQAAQASDLYEEILTIVLEVPEQALSEESSDRVVAIADQLRAEHGESIYAKFAALFSAQQAVENNDLARAESELQWILDNRQQGMFGEIDEGLVLTVSLRLARVILAQDDPQRALAFINEIDPKSFEPGFAELRGDIYLAMDRVVDARDAYIAAQQAGSGSDGLRMKLNNLPDPG
ncbi:MAG: tetratricopeptide repeat protein [Pseudomonadales bacterium]|nr:tetratricopeptide repeat protein [Pseudomonadales bacterium]